MSERASERAWLATKLFELCFVRFVLLWFVIAFLFVCSFCGVELDEATFGNYCLHGLGILVIPSKDCLQSLKKDVKFMQHFIYPKLVPNCFKIYKMVSLDRFGTFSAPFRAQVGCRVDRPDKRITPELIFCAKIALQGAISGPTLDPK